MAIANALNMKTKKKVAVPSQYPFFPFPPPLHLVRKIRLPLPPFSPPFFLLTPPSCRSCMSWHVKIKTNPFSHCRVFPSDTLLISRTPHATRWTRRTNLSQELAHQPLPWPSHVFKGASPCASHLPLASLRVSRLQFFFSQRYWRARGGPLFWRSWKPPDVLRGRVRVACVLQFLIPRTSAFFCT